MKKQSIKLVALGGVLIALAGCQPAGDRYPVANESNAPAGATSSSGTANHAGTNTLDPTNGVGTNASR